MNDRTMKRRAGVRGILLIALIAVAALAIASSMTYAAAGQSTARPSIREVTIIDPFLLTVIAVPATQPTDTLTSSSTSSIASPRPSIRIPHRPPVRSEFRPAL